MTQTQRLNIGSPTIDPTRWAPEKQKKSRGIYSLEVQADQTLPIGSRESFTWIILKTSHFVWSWTSRVYIYIYIIYTGNPWPPYFYTLFSNILFIRDLYIIIQVRKPPFSMFQGTRKGVPMVFVVFNLGILGDEITHKYIQRTPLNHSLKLINL